MCSLQTTSTIITIPSLTTTPLQMVSMITIALLNQLIQLLQHPIGHRIPARPLPFNNNNDNNNNSLPLLFLFPTTLLTEVA